MLAGCGKDSMPILNPVGEVARDEASVFYMSVIVMLVIIVPVMIGTLWIAWRYRASSNHDDFDPEFDDSPIIHQVTLFVPLFTIGILSAITWVYTHKLDPYRPLEGDKPPYEIQAVSLDYKWLFIYPEEGIATVNELVAPTNRPVTLRLTADPMMTSIFIPGLISQIYTMPGMETKANFLADKEAVLQGANAMYSGPGFEYQRFKTRLINPDRFENWVGAVKQGSSDAPSQAQMLDKSVYLTLTPQSTDNPVTHYSAIEPGLFTHIVRKYMPGYVMNPLPTKEQYDSGTRPKGSMDHMAMNAESVGHESASAETPASAEAQ